MALATTKASTLGGSTSTSSTAAATSTATATSTTAAAASTTAAAASTTPTITLRRKLVLGVHPSQSTPSPHQPCKRARHLLLHIIVAVADVDQTNLANGNRAPVESQKVHRLRQEVCRQLGSRDVLQYELPAHHHVLQPGMASLHVLEVARQPQANSDSNCRLVVAAKYSRLPSVEQLEFRKKEMKLASLLACIRGRNVLRLCRRQCRALDARARP
ncbi:unnamed protein product [Closterium sp. NIES-54]